MRGYGGIVHGENSEYLDWSKWNLCLNGAEKVDSDDEEALSRSVRRSGNELHK